MQTYIGIVNGATWNGIEGVNDRRPGDEGELVGGWRRKEGERMMCWRGPSG